MPPVDRLLPSPEADDFLAVARQIVAKDLRPRVDEAERNGEFPRDVFRKLGHAGLLGLLPVRAWFAVRTKWLAQQ